MGASRSAQLVLAGVREDQRRSVIAILETRGDDADHALVPFGPVETKGRCRDVDRRLERRERLVLHRGLDIAALVVQAIELRREPLRGRRIVGDEAGDADGHVREPAGGIDARTGDEAEIVGRRTSRIAARRGEERRNPGLHAPGADASQALLDQDAIDPIESNDVGDGAERNEVEQRREIRLGHVMEMSRQAQGCAQRAQHVEHHTDACQVLARESHPHWFGFTIHGVSGRRSPGR